MRVSQCSPPMAEVKIGYKYWNDACTEQELIEKLHEVKQLFPNKMIIMIYYDDPVNVSIIIDETHNFIYLNNKRTVSCFTAKCNT